VVHEVGDARDRLRGDVERIDQGRLPLRLREERLGLLVVDVEGEPDGDAPALRLGDRARDDGRGRLGQVEVVEREVEASLGRAEEVRQRPSDVEGALAPVRQGPDVDAQA
jgi:hypothetical protein